MNYIELINRFWELESNGNSPAVKRDCIFTGKNSNRLGWADNWTHSDDRTSANVGVSLNTMKTARKPGLSQIWK